MITITELKEHATETFPKIEALETEMELFLKRKEVRYVKVKIWLDGNLKISTDANAKIDNDFMMNTFNKKFGLYGHWNIFPGQFVTIREFVHWDTKEMKKC